jgi:hypothetical protein
LTAQNTEIITNLQRSCLTNHTLQSSTKNK